VFANTARRFSLSRCRSGCGLRVAGNDWAQDDATEGEGEGEEASTASAGDWRAEAV